jgi:hypothetical protein
MLSRSWLNLFIMYAPATPIPATAIFIINA